MTEKILLSAMGQSVSEILNKKRCGVCKFAVIQGSIYCRKNTPSINATTGNAEWPIVGANDYCNQFKYDRTKD